MLSNVARRTDALRGVVGSERKGSHDAVWMRLARDEIAYRVSPGVSPILREGFELPLSRISIALITIGPVSGLFSDAGCTLTIETARDNPRLDSHGRVSCFLDVFSVTVTLI